MKIMVDPPNGWRYGFPKQFNPSRDGNIREWLVANGYPQQEIDSFKSAFTVRSWIVPEDKPDFVQGIPTII